MLNKIDEVWSNCEEIATNFEMRDGAKNVR